MDLEWCQHLNAGIRRQVENKFVANPLPEVTAWHGSCLGLARQTKMRLVAVTLSPLESVGYGYTRPEWSHILHFCKRPLR